MEKQILYKYFSGKATEEEKKSVLDWIESDPANRKELQTERYIFDTLIMHTDRPARPATRRMKVRGLGRTLLRYAAVVAVTAGLLAVYFSQRSDARYAGMNTISVPSGQRVELTLPDGTKVFVNACSVLEYPAVFDGKERKVKLTGEAFFDVTHDEAHPFIVETFACNVEVLGTVFNVEAYPESNEFLASLISGSVKVTDAISAESVMLLPNQQARRNGSALQVEESPAHESFLWREGLIAYQDASFGELMADFEKYFGVKIVVERAQPSDKLFTGKIRITDGIDHALWVLQRNDSFTYRWSDARDVITIR